MELTPRQWWLYRLIKWASEQGEKLSIKNIIDFQEKYREAGKLTYSDLYIFKDADGNHSNCPQIYEDKDILNESDQIDKVVCVKNNQFYLGSESENIEYHNKLMHKVCDYSHKAKIIREKISKDGQCKLFTYDLNEIENSKGREYHEAFLKNESLIKEIDKHKKRIEQLEDLIKTYKNENKMWRDRYEYLRKEQ